MPVSSSPDANYPVHDPELARLMTRAATAFLDSLAIPQRRRVVYGVDSSERTTWDYRPVPRRGLPFTEMDSSQQRRAMALLASGLSRRGTMTALDIMSLEKILAGLENSHHVRDPERYYVTIFGHPAGNNIWGWRIEGHHLSLNFLVVEGVGIGCSPCFFGANPATVPEGSLTGYRTLSQEEDAARKLLALLNSGQREQAVIEPQAPEDIVTKWAARIHPHAPVGISFASLSGPQQHQIQKLLEVYLGRMASQLAENQMRAITRLGIGHLHFAWAGSTQPGGPHYYRLHGPSFLIEYDNTQDNANHIHSVWRDLERDWGDDLLKKHYEQSHQGTT